MPTNNIIVLDSYFNLTNKSNLTDEGLIRFNTMFGPPCICFFYLTIFTSLPISQIDSLKKKTF